MSSKNDHFTFHRNALFWHTQLLIKRPAQPLKMRLNVIQNRYLQQDGTQDNIFDPEMVKDILISVLRTTTFILFPSLVTL